MPTRFHVAHEFVVLKHFDFFPHRERDGQREEPPDIPAESFGFDGEFIAHGVKDDAQVLNDQVDENFFFAGYGSGAVGIRLENAAELRVRENLLPDVAMALG